MKLIAPALAAILATASASALSQGCTGTALTQVQLNDLLTGHTVCGRAVKPGYPGSASDKFQEEHRSGGQLWDWKLGDGPSVDPRKRVGDWSTAPASRNVPIATVTHIYSPTVTSTWAVYGPSTNSPGTSVYSFCTTATTPVEHVRAFVRTGATGCASYPL